MISWLSEIDKSAASLYIAYLFSAPSMKKQIANLQAGSTVAYLSISMLKNFDIILPPLPLREQFAAFVHQSDKSKFELEQALSELTAT